MNQGRPINTGGKTRGLEPFEIKRLIKIASVSSNPERNVMLIRFMLFTCCRVSEALNVKVSDVYNGDYILPSVQFTKTKNKSPRIIPLNDNFKDDLLHYINALNLSANSPLFQSKKGGHMKPSSGSYLIKSLLNDAGLSDAKGSHCLRKSGLGMLVSNNVSLNTIIAISGHKDYSNLKYYLNSSIEKTSEAINTLNF